MILNNNTSILIFTHKQIQRSLNIEDKFIYGHYLFLNDHKQNRQPPTTFYLVKTYIDFRHLYLSMVRNSVSLR